MSDSEQATPGSVDGDRDATDSATPTSDVELDTFLASHAFGEPKAEDYVDPELARLEKRPPVLQLVLVLVVLGFTVFLAYALRQDLLYFFADETPLDLGAAENLSAVLAEDPDHLTSLGSNLFVHVSGVPQRRSGPPSGDPQFAQLVGAPVYVEIPRPAGAPEEDPLLRDVRPRFGPHSDHRSRDYVDVSGRLLQFDELGRRHAGIPEYYRDRYDIWFCGAELTPRQLDFRRLSEIDLQNELGRPPTQDELDAAFPCVNAVLVQGGKAPGDHAWYVGLFVFFGLVVLAGCYYIFRWLRQLAGYLKAPGVASR